MRNASFLSVMLILFLHLPASITWAQTISSQKGLTTVIFNAPQGKIKLFVPADIRPGELISGSLFTEPLGNNARQVEKNISELVKFTVHVDGNKIAVPAKQTSFKWQVPVGNQLQTPLELRDHNGIKTAVLHLQISSPDIQRTMVTPSCMIPTHALAGDPLRIIGPFDGDMANTTCSLNNMPLLVLTESRRECNVQYPIDATGVRLLTVKENNGSQTPACEQKISSVQMNISVGKLDLRKGQKTYINVSITGLQHLPDTAVLTLNNQTTDIVTMLPENNIRIPLAPDSVGTGIFNRRFDVLSLRTGSFTVVVNLDLPDVGYRQQPLQFGFGDGPGSWGYKGDHPCDGNSSPLTAIWRRAEDCSIELKVCALGKKPGEKDVIDYFFNKLSQLLGAGGNLGDKMGRTWDFKSQGFSIYARCYRNWDEWDVTYVCVDGKWVQRSMELKKSGRENLSDWIPLLNGGGSNMWLKLDSVESLIEAINKAVDCCPGM